MGSPTPFHSNDNQITISNLITPLAMPIVHLRRQVAIENETRLFGTAVGDFYVFDISTFDKGEFFRARFFDDTRFVIEKAYILISQKNNIVI